MTATPLPGHPASIGYTPTMTTRPLSHKRTSIFDRFWYGVCYYPEHWDAATRADDARRMQAAGINVVRMAEFAWDLMEPSEGVYDFSLFDATIRTLGSFGIKTIMGTPTAAPPRWLSLKHPEIRRVTDKGVVLDHGSRQHACHMNPVFRRHAKSITRAMTQHFAANPDVIGWQTDNEFHCHFSECHCDSCQVRFGEFLHQRYGSIAALNQAWGNAFWAQTYTDFSQIRTPRDQTPTWQNPHQRLDYVRYLSAGVTAFQYDQIELMRSANAGWWITHNGLFGNIDYHGKFSADLDILGIDIYPMFSSPQDRAHVSAAQSDRTRGFAGNFIVPEHQSGPGGQNGYLLDTPEPGEVRAATYATIGRGCDSLLFFRWRTARFGAEMYWYGLLDHDDVPRRRYAEAAQIGHEIPKFERDLLGTHVAIDCAVAHQPLEVDAADRAYGIGLPSPGDFAWGVHRELHDLGHAVGFVHPRDDLSELKLYVIPGWAPFDDAWIAPLRAWVEAGGTLVLGARSGTHRLSDMQVPALSQPAAFAELAGIRINEFGRQNASAARPLSFTLGATEIASELFYEQLALHGAEVIATWKDRHLAGSPAITRHRLGKGSVIWVGTCLTRDVFKALLPTLIGFANAKPVIAGLPAGCSVSQRVGPGRTLTFVTNHTSVPQTMQAPSGTDLLTGEVRTAGTLTLEPYGVAILKS